MGENLHSNGVDEIKETLRKQLRLLAERSEMTHDEFALAVLTSEMRALSLMLMDLP